MVVRGGLVDGLALKGPLKGRTGGRRGGEVAWCRGGADTALFSWNFGDTAHISHCCHCKEREILTSRWLLIHSWGVDTPTTTPSACHCRTPSSCVVRRIRSSCVANEKARLGVQITGPRQRICSQPMNSTLRSSSRVVKRTNMRICKSCKTDARGRKNVSTTGDDCFQK